MKETFILKSLLNSRYADIVPVHDSKLAPVEGWTRRQLLVAVGAVSLSALVGTKSEAQSEDSGWVNRKGLKRIDVHHHFIPPQYLKEGPPSVAMSKVENWSPAHAIEDMDRHGIDTSVLSFSSPYLWFPGLDNGRRLARLCNDTALKSFATIRAGLDYLPGFRHLQILKDACMRSSTPSINCTLRESRL